MFLSIKRILKSKKKKDRNVQIEKGRKIHTEIRKSKLEGIEMKKFIHKTGIGSCSKNKVHC